MSGDHIVEHEVLAELATVSVGRPLAWTCDFVRLHGRGEPLAVLREMWRTGYIALHDDRERPLLSWECADVWRRGEESQLVWVRATPHRLRWIRE